MQALRGFELKGKPLDLKFAVALAEPDPASSSQPQLRAKQRVGAGPLGARHVGSTCPHQVGLTSYNSAEAEKEHPPL